MGEAVRIMIHDSTWLGRTRAIRRMRLVAPLGLLLACVLLASFAASASASTYEIRGEWSFEYKSTGQPALAETGLINHMDEATGVFSGAFKASVGVETSLEGTLTGTTVSFTSTTMAPFGIVTFVADAATINTTTNELSGTGAYYLNGVYDEPGEVTAKRLRSDKQIEEQEKKEQEEREARANIRGEWALTLEAGPETLRGIAVINEEASTKNIFASESAMFEGSQGGTFSGTLKGSEASVTVTTEGNATLEIPPGSFTSGAIALSSSTDPTSMSGEGTFTFGSTQLTGKLTATRIKTHQQVLEREENERKAREQQEKEAQEAQEAKEKAEQEAKAKAEQEAKAKREREAQEAVEKANKIVPPPPGPSPLPLLLPNPVTIAAGELSKGVTVGHSRVVALELSNPNHLTVGGKLQMFTATDVAGSKSAKKKLTPFGTIAFTITSNGTTTVKLKLSSANYATLVKHRRLRVVVNITTTANGESTPAKSYGVTLNLTPTTTTTHKH
jgi:hypothetical protein